MHTLFVQANVFDLLDDISISFSQSQSEKTSKSQTNTTTTTTTGATTIYHWIGQIIKLHSAQIELMTVDNSNTIDGYDESLLAIWIE